MNHYIAEHNGAFFGICCVSGEFKEAVEAMTEAVPEVRAQDYRNVSQDRYENTVIDLRYEDGEVQQ